MYDGKRDIVPSKWELTHQNEGITDASGVQYVCRTGNFKDKGFEYSGVLQVLSTILSYDYLWINVRVLGGAYGAMCRFFTDGLAYFTSYRDPNLMATNDLYEGIPDFVEKFDCDERDMLKYVIGTVSRLDITMSTEVKTLKSIDLYLKGITDERRQKNRDAVLNATPEDIRRQADLIRAVLSENAFCVFGNENKIKEVSDKFDKVRELTPAK